MKITVFLEKLDSTGLHYPVIRVEGFERVPFICRSLKTASTGEPVFRQGAIYLRKYAAETAEIIDPADWEDLISTCVALRRSEFIDEFRALMERMAAPAQPLTASA